MLSDRANALLDLEERFPTDCGAKRTAVLRMSSSLARHYQELNALVDDAEALEERPILVHRLQRQRERRLIARAARSFVSVG